MIEMYCKKHHKTENGHLCPSCTALHEYAIKRLNNCPFSNDKGNCSDCQIHCYKPEMRQQIRAVMRYSGARMYFKTPVLALLHTISSLIGKRNKKKK
ncbi:MAG: nitrous oxide-stimulated promoter family protein [Candidatus Magnetoovum sp. WYHC-5]|nr:nitrous oxide-stimulated promoter family protein [Candidatus Magnetoovum sp. WYHC-5]